VHRDIKPQNIRLGVHGEVKLLDFGVAFSSDVDRQARTMSNTVLGSLPYMAPERFTTARPGTASDIYALLSCLYEAIQGERLQGSPTPVEMYARASSQEDHDLYLERQLARLPADLPSSVLQLLKEGLAFEEGSRPSARDLATRCEEVAAALPGLSLKGWARSLPPLKPRAIATPWVGRMLVDGEELPPTRSPSTLPPSLLEGDLYAEPPREPSPPPALPAAPAAKPEEESASGLPLWLLGGAVFVVTVLVGVTTLLLWGPAFGPAVEAPADAPEVTEPNQDFDDEAVVLWKVAGDVRGLELRNETDAYGPGWTPAGAYQLYADFGAGPKWVKNVELEEDTEPVFRCDRATRTCTVE
jgi:serine/threonine-protein kinase